VWQVRDDAGIVTSDEYDFKGNLQSGKRDLRTEHKTPVNWAQQPAPATSETFTSSSKFDAMGRVIEAIAPDGSVTRPRYNEANLLEAIEVRLRGAAQPLPFVRNIDYDAKGQRTRIEYNKNDTPIITEYSYDPETFRLMHLVTTRPGHPEADKRTLQDLSYTYDPVGNITHIQDDAQQTIYFRNQRVEPSNDYVYDAVYRLISAQGREHLGQTGGQRNPPTAPDAFNHFHTNLDHPGNGDALGTYIEEYDYDAVGNFKAMRHRGTDPVHPGWTRSYAYNEPSLLEPTTQKSNRLSSTQVGAGTPEPYTYDAHGNMITMPHLPQMRWDFEDQLTEVDLQGGGTAYYVYDAGGQRVRKVIERNGATVEERIYLGGYEVYRKRQGGTLQLERQTLHVMDDKERIALVETKTVETEVLVANPQSLIRYQLGNHLGSAAVEVDDAARVISYEEYFPYGSTSYQAVDKTREVPVKRYRYTGKERDEETGFSYHGARYYAGWLGKWTSCDPIGIADGWNVYVYAKSRPTNLRDQTGTTCKSAIATCSPEEPVGSISVQDQEQTSSEKGMLVDKTNDEHAVASQALKKGKGSVQPFDVKQGLIDSGKVLQQTETLEYKQAGAVAVAEKQRQAEYEADVRHEAETEKDLPGTLGSVTPLYGSGKSSYVHFSHGNYGRGIVYGALAISDVFLVKSLIQGGAKLTLKLGSTVVADSVGESGRVLLSSKDPILFGQKRVGLAFRQYSKASEAIRGRTLVEVAEDLKAGRISPDDLPIDYFVRNGQKIAINNRGLGALTLAGMEPTVTRELAANNKLLGRLLEKPINSLHPIPGRRLPVTISSDGSGHAYTIIMF
jgi:RHS repeat-associated protein